MQFSKEIAKKNSSREREARKITEKLGDTSSAYASN